MDAKQWKNIIKAACEDAGTYREYFNSVIDSLAQTLEKRDDAAEHYDGCPIVEHTNSHGETNLVKNPALMMWADLNRDALAYWRELGLTPKGLRQINEAAIKETKKQSTLEKALNALEA